IENNGFEAWCVGGAVRDHIMGKSPFDYDITTNAKPDDIINMFPKTVPTGLQHGTVTVVTDNGNIEITTYRADGEYIDHRSPERVTFVSTVDADLSRRDFTMNAICYNPKKGFYDPQNGIADIHNRIIRAIGDPNKRFSEDALRIMRAFRFSAQLGFDIEDNTKNSAISLCGLLKDISVERIYVELKRALTSKFARNFEPLLKCGAFKHLCMNITSLPNKFDTLPYDFALRFAYICKEAGIDASSVLRKLKTDNLTINNTNIFLYLLNQPFPKTKIDLKVLLRHAERFAVERLLDFYTSIGEDTKILYEEFQNIFVFSEPYRVDMLDINGNELVKLGFKGKEIGEKLDYLLNLVIKDSNLNKKAKLIEKLK
ncbi:MAG: CCA tRNA nucleotidyltransferase, partial [Clostridia bacterium]|nr:CCA tRNA nucleotidyltransferase [Clostridia bacterium]